MPSSKNTSSRKPTEAPQRAAAGFSLGLRYLVRNGKHLKHEAALARIRHRIFSNPPGAAIPLDGYSISFNDAPNLYILYKDLFVHRIYHFEAQRPDPLILDCDNIGMSVLYFKRIYPQARILAFEPDPDISPMLQQNIAENRLANVQWLPLALSRDAGKKTFFSDGVCGSGLAEPLSAGASEAWKTYEVSCARLRDYLTEPVDFMKMNIEGAEYEVLADSEDRLPQIREMIIEYHHLPGLRRSLHEILEILHRRGFEYLINDFDSEQTAALSPRSNSLPIPATSF